jgi:hypothetical protein
MKKIYVALATAYFAAMAPSAVHAACEPTDIVIADASDNSGTMDAVEGRLIDPHKLDSVVLPFFPDDTPESFLEPVKEQAPRLLIAHFSMLNPGEKNRFALLNRMVQALEKLPKKPVHYLVYSSSLGPEGWTLDGLHEAKLFLGIDSNRISLVHVPRGARFAPESDSEKELSSILIGLLQSGLCE